MIVTRDYASKILLGLCAAVLTAAALQVGSPVFAPVAFALFIIAIVWPVQKALQSVMPKLAALLGTMLITAIVVALLGSVAVWGFSRAIQWLVGNAPRFQELYMATAAWFESHNIFIASLAVEHFNVGWLIGVINEIKARLSGLTAFAIVTSIYVILGLLEIEPTANRLRALQSRSSGPEWVGVFSEIGAKFRHYMYVRSLMSLTTGVVIWAFTLAAGLELATSWGAIAFVLNYIPFLGPLIATVFPTLFALVQTESWQFALAMFVGLNVIQFMIGSYMEPRLAGAKLAISPFVVMFAIFFWTYLWGIPGTFIGVPIVIAMLAICEQYPSSRWFSDLLSGREERT